MQIHDSRFLLTGAGAETYLLFIQQFPLRDFCAFEIFEDEPALARLEQNMLAPIVEAAASYGHDLLLDSLVWRAHPDFAGEQVDRINRLAVDRTRDFVARWRQRTSSAISVFINGDVGPRGDGYRVDGEVSVAETYDYHRRQIEALASAGVDVISCLTMTNVNEAIGIVRAAADVDLPCIVSPTIETDGNTPEGKSLGQFIDEVEQATSGRPLFYMVNCAHPIHLEPVLVRARERGKPWLERFQGFRANASRKSHAELDQSTEIDRGHPEALASQVGHLCADFGLRLIGGCCGTDAEHLQHMASTVAANRQQRDRSVGLALGGHRGQESL